MRGGQSGRRRVLFVSYTAQWTGPTISLLLLLRQLRDRYDVSVLMDGSGPLAQKLDSEGIRHWSMDGLNKWSIPRIAALIRKEGMDLVYANNTHGSSRNAFLAAAITRRPFVCHVRGMLWHWGWLRGLYLRRARAVIAVSRASGASVERFVREGALHIVYNGVPDPGPWADEDGGGVDGRRSLGIPDAACLVLSVAHLMPRKGQLHAVEALARVAAERPEIHVCLAGRRDRDPAYTERLIQRAVERGVEERVHLLGFRTDIRELLSAADVFLHTAVADPHPRAVLEAMAAGLPVVAFDVDGVGETVVHRETGLLVDPEDDEGLGQAIGRLARCPEDRTRMGRAGVSRVREHFSEEAAADRVDAILSGVLDKEEGTA